MIFETYSPEETQKIAENLSQKFRDKGGVIALNGKLGAGKTTFTQGFCNGLGITEKVISPTFVLVRQHPLPNYRKLYHVDLYRLEGKINTRELGLEDIFSEEENICLIEWADKIESDLPKNYININIKIISDSQREVIVSGNL